MTNQQIDIDQAIYRKQCCEIDPNMCGHYFTTRSLYCYGTWWNVCQSCNRVSLNLKGWFPLSPQALGLSIAEAKIKLGMWVPGL